VTEQEWDALVRRLDAKAQSDPSGYRRRVGALALLGYGFLLFAVVVLLALAALVVVAAMSESGVLLKLLIPIGALIFVSGTRLTSTPTPSRSRGRTSSKLTAPPWLQPAVPPRARRSRA
jgi:hypothetical protein